MEDASTNALQSTRQVSRARSLWPKAPPFRSDEFFRKGSLFEDVSQDPFGRMQYSTLKDQNMRVTGEHLESLHQASKQLELTLDEIAKKEDIKSPFVAKLKQQLELSSAFEQSQSEAINPSIHRANAQKDTRNSGERLHDTLSSTIQETPEATNTSNAQIKEQSIRHSSAQHIPEQSSQSKSSNVTAISPDNSATQERPAELDLVGHIMTLFNFATSPTPSPVSLVSPLQQYTIDALKSQLRTLCQFVYNPQNKDACKIAEELSHTHDIIMFENLAQKFPDVARLSDADAQQDIIDSLMQSHNETILSAAALDANETTIEAIRASNLIKSMVIIEKLGKSQSIFHTLDAIHQVGYHDMIKDIITQRMENRRHEIKAQEESTSTRDALDPYAETIDVEAHASASHTSSNQSHIDMHRTHELDPKVTASAPKTKSPDIEIVFGSTQTPQNPPHPPSQASAPEKDVSKGKA